MHGLRLEEARAADILAVVLDGVVVPRDVPGAPDGTHDFDIDTAQGRIAVEVTRVVDGPVLEAARLRQRADWACPNLAASWDLSHRPSLPDVRGLHREIEQQISVLEGTAVKQFDVRVDDELPAAAQLAVARLAELGIRSGRSIGSAGNPPTILFGSVNAGSTGPDLVNSAVETNAGRKAKKLAIADAYERHLFVWLDSTAEQVNAAMSFDVLPKAAPALPESIDVAWIAPGPYIETSPRLTGRLWKATAGVGWADVGEVREREQEDETTASV